MRVVGLAFPVGLESHAHPWAEGQWPRGAGWRNFKLNVAMGFACFSHGKLLRDLGEDGLCLPDKHLGGKYGAMRPGTGGGSGWGFPFLLSQQRSTEDSEARFTVDSVGGCHLPAFLAFCKVLGLGPPNALGIRGVPQRAAVQKGD